MNNLIVFEKPLIIIHDFSFSVKNVRSPLHEVKTEKKSWSVEKQAGFKLHVTLVCYKLLQVCSVFYLAKNTNGALGGFFYHLFSIIYAFLTFCCTFCENFRKARKNIPVFKNDSQRLFKIIFQSLLNLRCCVRCRWIQTFTYIKTVVIVQKIDLIQKYWVNFPNFQIKTFCWSFFIT